MAVPESRREILKEIIAAERQAHLLLERAARLTPDAEERALYCRLAARELDALEELQGEKLRVDDEYTLPKTLDL